MEEQDLLSFEKLMSANQADPQRQVSTQETRAQALLGPAYPRDACHDIRAQFESVVRSGARSMFVNLLPHPFHWIEFRRARRQIVDVQALMLRQERLHQFALMNWMVIPHQHNRSANPPQQHREKGDNFVAPQSPALRADHQFQSTALRCDQHGPQQIQAFVMIQTGAHTWCLAARCPGPLERRNQRKTAFIFDHQRRVQVTPLFLSAARCNAASAPRRDHPDQTDGAVVVDNSSPDAARYARPHLGGSARQSVARSTAQSDRASSNLQHNHRHTHRVSSLVPTAASVGPSIGRGGPVSAWSWARETDLLVANGAPSA
jgi:hypothetical protein